MSCPLCGGTMHATNVVEVTGELEDYEDDDGNTQERVKETEAQVNYLRWECDDCKHQEREDFKDETE